MLPLSSEGLNKETAEAVFFYTPAFDALNNFSAHTVDIWGKHFPTAEHAFQWKKFSDIAPDIAEKILHAGCPEDAQRIAHQNKASQPSDWQEIKVGVMEEILRAKLAEHETVRETLIRSGNRTIVENSPTDSFWGCGPNGDGKNMMGVLWMKIRKDNLEK
ncbi:MAG: hypothetical protein COV91_04665 [Candidatus Taylorbacteria bacterium CG11_big_fil_rev_8_21_14_0_20_46_11]|uniref:NADAR domain-containing protein n=1 Tax=Candidatus Taylorbacteria bacterium CG11_big_fil_rev_8_21_14_0_20_46_11 TaxID=1975025 RepID=A0A2H0KAQ4_9BACT|nr:MAG: hypothetical protein COV91_04665 [Candidatus Taylorbacteria bacterium CG11_big_fil_rev_8_21_14_0_20_46_11]